MCSRPDLAAKTITVAYPTNHLCTIRNIGRLVVFLIFMATAQMAQAQDATPTPTPTAEELRLQEEKRLLLLKKDIEEAKKAIRDAQPQPEKPPEPTATPLAGDATLSEGVRLETELVSYNSVSRAAKEIATAILNKTNNPQNIAIFDAQIVKDWRFYKALFPAFEGQVTNLVNEYKNALQEGNPLPLNVPPRANMKAASIAGALATGTNLLKSAIDLAALFRTDTKIEGRQVTVNQNALVAELLRELKTQKSTLTLYYPGVFPPRRPSCPEQVKDQNGQDVTIDKCTEGSTVLIDIGLLFSYKATAEASIKKDQDKEDLLVKQIKPTREQIAKLSQKLARVTELEAILIHLNEALKAETDPEVRKRLELVIARYTAEQAALGTKAELQAQIDAAKASIAGKEAQIDVLDAEIELLTDLNARFQKFVDEFVKVDSNGVNALALLVKSEDIDNAMREAESYWVEIQSVTAGGNNRTRKNLLRYFSGPKIDHSGGVVVEYALYDKSGAVVYSDKVSCYEGYVEPKNITALKIEPNIKRCLAF